VRANSSLQISFVGVACLLLGAQAVHGQGKTQQGPPASSARETPTGAEIYAVECSGCHQANGAGISGLFPPLKSSAALFTDGAKRAIEAVLFGQQGSIIDGRKYTLPMPAFSEKLSNQEVAAVLNHIRNSWGQSAPALTDQDIESLAR
jgi:mono/diheme cytochrome c family protein